MNTSWIKAVDNGATVLSVNQRLSRHLIHVWRQQRAYAGTQFLDTPQILPLSNWAQVLHAQALAEGVCDVTLMSNLASQRLWHKVIAQSEHGSSLLNTQATAASAQRAWSIQQQWQVEMAAPSTATFDQQAFHGWQKAYLRLCQKTKQIDEAVLLTQLTHWVSEHREAFVLPKNMLLAGFLNRSQQLEKMILALEKTGVSVEPIELTHRAHVKRVQADDDEQLFHAIAQKIRQCVQTAPEKSYGLIVHDLQQRRAQVLRAFDAVFFPSLSPDQINQIVRPYDVSLGVSLADQAAVRSALLLLKLLIKGIDNQELSALLLSPYLSQSDNDLPFRERVDRKCREHRVRQAGLARLISLLPETLGLRKVLVNLSKKRLPKSASCARWADWFSVALADSGWPGKSLSSEEYQIAQAWHGCLDDLQKLDDNEKLTPPQAFSLLQQMCSERLFQLETPSMPVQIVGRLESHGIEFDKLWVAGMDAEQWPAVSTPSPFLSIQLQQKAGVPDASATARLALAQEEFELWSHSAQELFACHVATRDGQTILPASIVAHLPLATEALSVIDVHATMKLVQRSGAIVAIDDPNGPALAEGETVRGGARLLENQARCPFKAFALHRLHIKPLEEAGIGLDPRQAGTLLHDSLEYFWDQTKTHETLMSMSDAALDESLSVAITHAINKMGLEKSLQNLQKRFLTKLLQDWVNQCEKPRAPFEVVEVEGERELELSGIKMNLKVDRIDQLASGQKIILDYKTGQGSAISSWSEERIESPQLPLYSTTDESIEGVSFAQVFPHKHRYIGITAEEGMLPSVKTGSTKEGGPTDWSQWRAHWQNALNNIAHEVKQGVATITPVKNACQFCELSSLCRIDSQLLEVEEEPNAQSAYAQTGDRT